MKVGKKHYPWVCSLTLSLPHFEPSIYQSAPDWEIQFANAPVHIQWDTERSLRGAGLNQYSIQAGISRHLIREYVDEWVVQIVDFTATVAKIRSLIQSGKEKNARRLLPPERVYPIFSEIARRIQIQ